MSCPASAQPVVGGVERVEACLRDLGADAAAVRCAIDELDLDGLRRFGYDAFHLNLLALFGASWGPSRVAAAAERCAREKLWRGWEYYASFHRLTLPSAPPPRPRLRDEVSALEHWLEAGRPVVFCSHHLGDYRDLPTDLCLRGREITLPLDRSAHRQSSRMLETVGPLLGGRLQVVDVETPGGSLAVARRLLSGGAMFVYADGNTGLDGPTGGSTRQEIDFLGYQVAVKDGWARLAASSGAAIVPVLAPRDRSGVGRIVCGTPQVPEGRLRGDRREEFVATAVEATYGVLADLAEDHAEQWETVCFVHRWRSFCGSTTSAAAPPVDAGAVERALARGVRFRLDRRRIVDSVRDGHRVWLDTRTLQAIRPPADLDRLAADLGALGGEVDAAWLARCDPPGGQRAVRFLAQLVARGTIVADPRTGLVDAAPASALQMSCRGGGRVPSPEPQ